MLRAAFNILRVCSIQKLDALELKRLTIPRLVDQDGVTLWAPHAYSCRFRLQQFFV